MGAWTEEATVGPPTAENAALRPDSAREMLAVSGVPWVTLLFLLACSWVLLAAGGVKGALRAAALAVAVRAVSGGARVRRGRQLGPRRRSARGRGQRAVHDPAAMAGRGGGAQARGGDWRALGDRVDGHVRRARAAGAR